VELFNGKDLAGWVVDGPKETTDKATGKTAPIWTVKDGLIHCSGKAFGFLRYDKTFSDFAYHVEYKMEPGPAGKPSGVNSGIGVRTTVFDVKNSRDSRPSFYGYEIQLLDDGDKPPSKGSTGSLYRYVAPTAINVKPAGEWNTADVECVGPRIKVSFNGKVVVDVDQTTVPAIKDKPLFGYVCVQSHGGGIVFRNLRIREIKK
jgi:hypothetical protein